MNKKTEKVMPRHLVKKVDDYVNSNLPWWDLCDSPATCRGASAGEVLGWLRGFFGDDLDKDLERELVKAC